MNNRYYIQSNLFLKYDDIIQGFSKIPLSFNQNLISKEELDNNYLVLEKELNYKFNKKVMVNQTHSSNVVVIDENNINSIFEETDGMITSLKNVALVIRVADCQAITLYDPIKKIIGNIHSGWKGTLNKIIINALKIMINDFKCDPKNIIAYISPCINKCCFEVDEDVKNLFINNYHNINSYIYLGQTINNKQKYYIDTVSINKQNMLEMGLIENNIDIANICTKCNSKVFHSYRADKDKSGRNVSIIEIKN